ncbi:hypothetical protein [Streptomyces nymphaeiformis]|uniref:hypothetical protein n=1 Tax=Streptomyces nymphaeiformis TaxID=2663842 RepID=UPI0035E40D3A
MSADERTAWQQQIQEGFKGVLADFDNYRFFTGESMNQEAVVVLMKTGEDGETPFLYYIRQDSRSRCTDSTARPAPAPKQCLPSSDAGQQPAPRRGPLPPRPGPVLSSTPSWQHRPHTSRRDLGRSGRRASSGMRASSSSARRS